MIKYIVSFSILAATMVAIILIRLSDFELSGEGKQRTITFKHNNDVLVGTLILPHDKVSPPFVLLVHGDGPQDRWSEGGYIPLVKFLVSQGIAVFSWDKPGVSGSTGNWLAQTMSDRAEEAAIALKNLREQPELKKSRGGYLGFSQAGWVVPQASQLTTTEFAVLIGAAINWRNQGIYYTGQRLKAEGRSMSYILEAQNYDAQIYDRQFTKQASTLPCNTLCSRPDFERRNSQADARKDISVMQTPILVLMGKDDRNVDPDETVAVWAEMLPLDTTRCIKELPGANHGLLRSELFDYQLVSQWPLWKKGLFLLLGKYSYSPGALSTVSSWVLNQTCAN
ncbi:alpha/beta hydrolase family protein [Klebsiella variicola]|uniref:alpha/beta hydrolase family protein n=1 Tax=Klebsiella variicola TaxID=244366 RepID=UPI00236472A5|nr:alpha/beta hydrolase [Klebsiella variicola]MDD1951980.1 alpha/beta hydrolase [Klebsiella variicola]HBS7231286.1 alpha/beta hydrolase [Klebsiella pneumoniae]